MSKKPARKGVAALLLLTALGACDGGTKGQEPTVNESGNATAAVVLPPSVKRTSSYRCKDNSIESVDFLDDDRSINLRDEKGIRQFRAAEPNGPYDSGPNGNGGVSVVVKGSEIVIEQAGREPRQCKS